MDCFNNLIGIGRRQSSTSESGLYLEDIGITLGDADAIVDDRFTSGEALLNNIISFTQKEFIDDFKTSLRTANEGRKIFTPNSILENGAAGYYKDNLPTLAADATKYRGLSVRIERYPYTSFHLGELNLFTQVTGTVNVLVYDLVENKLLDTLAVTCVANEISTLTVNKT